MKPHNPKFYIARRCSRFDVYPDRYASVAIAHDYNGFWQLTSDGQWFKTPSSFVLLSAPITEEEAIAHKNRNAFAIA